MVISSREGVMATLATGIMNEDEDFDDDADSGADGDGDWVRKFEKKEQSARQGLGKLKRVQTCLKRLGARALNVTLTLLL